jgi:hypothetical protein
MSGYLALCFFNQKLLINSHLFADDSVACNIEEKAEKLTSFNVIGLLIILFIQNFLFLFSSQQYWQADPDRQTP